MQKTLVQITAQILENYAFGNEDYDGVPKWKAKGGQTFSIQVDSDFFYDTDICIKAISKLLEEQSNDYCKYVYVDHELVFFEPIKLDSERFENLFNVFAQEKYRLDLVDGNGRETTLGKIVEEGDYDFDNF